MVHGIAATATDTDDLDDCTLRGMIYEFEHFPLSFQLSSFGFTAHCLKIALDPAFEPIQNRRL
jgi:hypothetical protein